MSMCVELFAKACAINWSELQMTPNTSLERTREG